MIIVSKKYSCLPVVDFQSDHFVLYEGKDKTTTYYISDCENALSVLHWLLDNGNNNGPDTCKTIVGENDKLEKLCTLKFRGNENHDGVDLNVTVMTRPKEYNFDNVYFK